MQHLGALNPNEAALATQLREKNIRPVHFHHLPDLIQTVQQNVVDLARADNDILDKDLHSHHQLPQLLLCTSNLFRRLTRNINFVLASTIRTGRDVAENLGEGRREIDGGACSGLNELDVLAGATTDQGVHRRVQFDSVHMAFELISG